MQKPLDPNRLLDETDHLEKCDDEIVATPRILNHIKAIRQQLSSKYSSETVSVIIQKVILPIVRQYKDSTKQNDKSSLSVKEAQSKLSTVLKSVRQGQIQLIGEVQKNMEPVVMISVDQLSQLIEECIDKPRVGDMQLFSDSVPAIKDELTIEPGAAASIEALKL